MKNTLNTLKLEMKFDDSIRYQEDMKNKNIKNTRKKI